MTRYSIVWLDMELVSIKFAHKVGTSEKHYRLYEVQ